MENYHKTVLLAHYQEHLREGKIEKGSQHGTGHVIQKQESNIYSSTRAASYDKYCFVPHDEMSELEHVTHRNY